MAQNDRSASRHLPRRALLFFAAWAITLLGWLALYREFRDAQTLDILGTRYAGGEALLIMGICALIPITLFALAFRNLALYLQLTRR